MAKRKAGRTARRTAPGRKRAAFGSSAKRSGKKAKPERRAKGQKTAASSKRTGSRKVVARPATRVRRQTTKPSAVRPGRTARPKAPALDRVRRTLVEPPVTGPPSALNLDRHGSAVERPARNSGAARRRTRSWGTDIAGGDPRLDLEDRTYPLQAPGGDNPTRLNTRRTTSAMLSARVAGTVADTRSTKSST